MLHAMAKLVGISGIGTSPDGIGSTIPTEPITRYYPVSGELAFLEPKDTSGAAAAQSAGFTALLAAVGLGVGTALGKGWGAVAGLMLAGAVSNGYRAQKWMNDEDPSKRHEAVVSATFGVFEAIMGSYAAWKASKTAKD
jgi:hypothetical protein